MGKNHTSGGDAGAGGGGVTPLIKTATPLSEVKRHTHGENNHTFIRVGNHTFGGDKVTTTLMKIVTRLLEGNITPTVKTITPLKGGGEVTPLMVGGGGGVGGGSHTSDAQKVTLPEGKNSDISDNEKTTTTTTTTKHQHHSVKNHTGL